MWGEVMNIDCMKEEIADISKLIHDCYNNADTLSAADMRNNLEKAGIHLQQVAGMLTKCKHCGSDALWTLGTTQGSVTNYECGSHSDNYQSPKCEIYVLRKENAALKAEVDSYVHGDDRFAMPQRLID
jgi:hypothetical protein